MNVIALWSCGANTKNNSEDSSLMSRVYYVLDIKEKKMWVMNICKIQDIWALYENSTSEERK